MEYTKISEGIYELKRPDMPVPARFYMSQKVLDAMEAGVITQISNVASLPGIQKYAICLPDAHEGYGFPIGGVAAFDEDEGGVISPGGVGYDINCIHPDAKVLTKHGAWLKISDMESNWNLHKATHFSLDDFSGMDSDVLLYLSKPENGCLYEIKTSSGRVLKVTGDHPIYTKDGMKRACDLNVGEHSAVYPFQGVKYEEPSNEMIIEERDIDHVLDMLDVNPKGHARKQVLNFLGKLNLLQLHYNHDKLPYLLKIMGFVFGDGCISFVNRKKGQVTFYGKREDLETIQRDLAVIGIKCGSVHVRERKHKIKTNYGVCEFEYVEHSVNVHSTAFAALLVALGTPHGVKTKIEYRMPRWIMRAPLWQKRLFLSAFFGAELSKPSTLNKYNFYTPQLAMNKAERLKDNAIDFLNDVRLLLSEFGVKSIFPVLVPGNRYEGKRGTTCNLRVHIRGNPANLLKLFENVGYEYNIGKHRDACLAANYIRVKSEVSKLRKMVREKARSLYSQGMPIAEIASALGGTYTPRQFLEHSVWDGARDIPRIAFDFPSYDEYKKQALGGSGLVWDEIKTINVVPYQGPVYDITIDDENHNFVADSFVVSNCGVRMIRTNLTADEVKPKMKELMDVIFKNVPCGVGSKKIRVTKNELKDILVSGSKWCVEHGMGWDEDLCRTEENGTMPDADPSTVSEKAFTRGEPQVGTLGSGNHFLEVQKVSDIFDVGTAKAFGIEDKDQVTVMVHCGSRGFGHQVCDEALRYTLEAAKKYGITLRDRELACAPINSPEAQRYWKGMCCAVNYAFANRQAIMHWVRESFAQVFKRDAEEMGMDLVYDVCHNIAKKEEHEVDGKKKLLYVHRKGGTRAFGPGRKEIPKLYRSIGQPVIIPGTMGTSSYLLVGTDVAMKETFGSTCHGAGRTMSRHGALREYTGEQVMKELEAKGEVIRADSMSGIAEEAPHAYKDVDQVIESVSLSGISRKVARMLPMGVMKG